MNCDSLKNSSTHFMEDPTFGPHKLQWTKQINLQDIVSAP